MVARGVKSLRGDSGGESRRKLTDAESRRDDGESLRADIEDDESLRGDSGGDSPWKIDAESRRDDDESLRSDIDDDESLRKEDESNRKEEDGSFCDIDESRLSSIGEPSLSRR